MWYFAYGSNLNARVVKEWFRHHGLRAPALGTGRAAVLDNYRLGFCVYSEYWGGGIADIAYDPGKWVTGVLFELSEAELAQLDHKVGRRLDPLGREDGLYRRVEVKVSPLGKSPPVMAVTYQGVSADRNDIPPTRQYMDLVLQGACGHGLSTMWMAYLQTFATQVRREVTLPSVQDSVVGRRGGHGLGLNPALDPAC